MICNCGEEDPAKGWGDPTMGFHDHIACYEKARFGGGCSPLMECGGCEIALPIEKIPMHYLNTGHVGEYVHNGKLVIIGRDGRLQLCPECGKFMFVPFSTEVLAHNCGHKIFSSEGILSLLHIPHAKAAQHRQPSLGKQTAP